MFSSLVRRLLSHTKNASSRTEPARRRQHAKLRFENLEDRRMMAFTTPVTFAVGTNPAGIAVGDYNSDSRSDMAVVNSGPAGSVSILMSNSDGSFAPKVDYASGANSLDASAGDFNGDGKLDLAVIGTALEILLGNGDGTFGAPIEFPVALSAHSVKVADFNNDGILDVGTTNTNSASVSLGNGDGSFQAPLTTPVAGNNINLVVGDFNRDGNLDMATSNTNSIGTVNVLRGHGDGSFDTASSYYAFTAPVYLATGDFNEDGYLDFACPNSYAATSMSVLINNGDGTYGAPHTYGISQTGYEIEVADFNNDGYDDFAVRGASKYMVSHGKGDGTFFPSVEFATPAGRFEAGTHGDFNGDGAVDLAYPSSSGVTVVTNDNADAQNLAGAVTFRVTAPATTTSKSVLPMTISAIDANGDVVPGFRGMVFISSSDPAASTASGYAFNPADAGIPYLFTAADAGSHSFTGAIRLVTAGNQTVKVSAPNMAAATVTVNVTGQVRQMQISAPTASVAGDTFNITVSAIDTTGAIAPGYSTKVHFASSDSLAGLPADYTFTEADAGTHTFQVTLKTAGTVFVSATELGGSINGGVNVNVAPQAASTLTLAGAAGAIGVIRPVTIVARDVYGNQAMSYSGTVHFTSSDAAAILPSDAALINGMTTVDVKFLTVGTQTLTATDIVNDTITGTLSSNATAPIAASFAVSGYPASIAGNTNGFTVKVFDTIGQTASDYTGTVYFTSSDVQAGLPASYTFTTADAGIHNFFATLKTAGNQSITVRDSSGSLTGTQAGIAVAASSFSKFMLSVPNGADSKGHILVSAGEIIQLKVSAVDLFGNSTSDYVGSIGLSSTDTAATAASYSFSAADGGEHVFSMYLATATVNGQVWSFHVVDSLNPASQATITNFEVVNGAAAIFKVALPASLVAGQAFTSKITALDAFGNTAKNYFGTVHFVTSSANAALPIDYTFDSTDLGVHDIEVSLNSAGTQSLTAVDASNSSVLGTDSGNVDPSVATSLSVTTSGTVVAGSTATVTVKATDAFGNVATGYRGTVSFASSDVLAGMPANFVFNNKEAGVATFNVTLKTAGNQSITVRDTVDATILGTAASNVVASSTAGSFVVSGFPSTTAGSAKTFTVQVKDTFGNLTSSYVGTVNFSSSDVQAGLPASYTFTSADAGSHAFSATLKTAGVQSISVKDSVTASAIGSQTGISVASSTATSIGISGFPATVAGVTRNFVVVAKDAYGNVSSGYVGNVSFSSTDIKAGLPASYTFTASDAGTHTFAATLKTAGLQSISVKDTTGTLLATQSGISITAAAAASFTLSAPSNVVVGVGFKVTVTAIDAFGNVATGYLGKVNLTSKDSKGGKNSYSFSSKDAGVATISYSFGSLGNQVLSIVDLANSLLSASITVNVISKK